MVLVLGQEASNSAQVCLSWLGWSGIMLQEGPVSLSNSEATYQMKERRERRNCPWSKSSVLWEGKHFRLSSELHLDLCVSLFFGLGSPLYYVSEQRPKGDRNLPALQDTFFFSYSAIPFCSSWNKVIRCFALETEEFKYVGFTAMLIQHTPEVIASYTWTIPRGWKKLLAKRDFVFRGNRRLFAFC